MQSSEYAECMNVFLSLLFLGATLYFHMVVSIQPVINFVTVLNVNVT